MFLCVPDRLHVLAIHVLTGFEPDVDAQDAVDNLPVEDIARLPAEGPLDEIDLNERDDMAEALEQDL